MNVVFDFGGVVFRWAPEELAAEVFFDVNDQRMAIEGIFNHQDWLELDRGTLSRDDAVKRAAQRTGLEILKVDALFKLVPSRLVPFTDIIDLLYRLKGKGHKLFVLSNMHKESIEYLEATNSFLKIFDGMVISCRLHLIKPEPGIYHYLLDTYRLNPRETVFIDDMERNIMAAAHLGMVTITFENKIQCERQLKAIGCL
jgi:haloacid dehalogenase superfamily, subfamily IA, variant 3 with third motif having DD or ED